MLKKRIISVLIIAIVLICTRTSFASVSNQTQAKYQSILKELISLITSEIQQLEQQIATQQTNQTATQGLIDNSSRTDENLTATSSRSISSPVQVFLNRENLPSIPPTENYHQQPQPLETQNSLSNSNYYTNSSGNVVHSPAYSNTVPVNATAQCRDGTYSFSQHRSGTCSHHGGVIQWL